MGEFEIQEGMLLRDLMVNKALQRDWIFTYGGGRIVRGVEVNGIKVWFPKKFRTVEEKLEKKLLGGMRLKSMEGEEPQFYLISDQSPSKDISSSSLSTLNLLKLHEAIAVILINKTNRTASLQEITEEIADRNLYRQQNGEGSFPTKSQIRLRTHPNTNGGKFYAHLFEFIEPDKVKLKDIK